MPEILRIDSPVEKLDRRVGGTMKNQEAVQENQATITGCHHMAICVHDIDEARRFYGEILSLVELEHGE